MTALGTVAAGSGNIALSPVALLILSIVVYFVGRKHGRGN